MKKQQRTGIDFVVEWNCEASGNFRPETGEKLSRDDLRNLARALGRMAARRDISLVRQDRDRSVPISDVKLSIVPPKSLN